MKRFPTIGTIAICGLSLLPLFLVGCNKKDAPRPTADACQLITGEEIRTVQGTPVTDKKTSARSDGDFRVSQCFFSGSEFSKSVSLSVTRRDPSIKKSPTDFWREIFARYDGKEKEDEADLEKRQSLRAQIRAEGEEEDSAPPKQVGDIGDEAYWISNRVGGVLYVLKRSKDAFIRISVGGPGDQQSKLDKSKQLAEKAFQRL